MTFAPPRRGDRGLMIPFGALQVRQSRPQPGWARKWGLAPAVRSAPLVPTAAAIVPSASAAAVISAVKTMAVRAAAAVLIAAAE